MIVGTFYEGDDDLTLAWMQHDVYGTALGVIMEGSNRYANFAKTLLDQPLPQGWGTVSSCDHRTLQGAHDLLAAAWRFRVEDREPDLNFEGRASEKTPQNWLDWLRDEMASWVDHPELVRAVMQILAHQNEALGYLAESQLCLALLDKFADVPWTPNQRTAFESDLERDLQSVEAQASGNADKVGPR